MGDCLLGGVQEGGVVVELLGGLLEGGLEGGASLLELGP